MSISEGMQSSRRDQKLCSNAITCLPGEFTLRHFLCLMLEKFEFSQRTKRVIGESVVVMKLLQDGTNKNMFGHPTGNTFVLVSSMSRFKDDEAYCSVVTRKCFSPKFSST